LLLALALILVSVLSFIYSLALRFNFSLGSSIYILEFPYFVIHSLYDPIQLFVSKYILFFSMIIITTFIWVPIIVHFFPSLKRLLTTESTTVLTSRSRKILLVLIVTITFFVSSYLRLTTSEPLGGDTLWNIYYLNRIDMFGLSNLIFRYDKPLYYFALYLIKTTFHLSSIDLFRIVPGLLSAAYVFTYYFYAKIFLEGTNLDKTGRAVFFCAFFAGVSTFSLRIFGDLHSMLMAMILQNLCYASLLIYLKRENIHYLIYSSVFLILVLLTHWPLFLLTVLPLVVFSVVSLYFDIKKTVVDFIIVIFPSIIVLALFTAVQVTFPTLSTIVASPLRSVFPSLNPQILIDAGQSQVGGNPLGFFDLSSPESYVHRLLLGDIGSVFGNVLPSLFAIFGSIFVINYRKTLSRLISTQIAVYSILILIPGFMSLVKWRFAILLPIPIMAGMGVHVLLILTKKLRAHLQW